MHGNSRKNPNPYHLYSIFEEKTSNVFKYGITDDPIGKDGLPARTRKQLIILNLAAGFLKFIAKILISRIPGRAEAERIEKEHIERHKSEFGRKPPGNRK